MCCMTIIPATKDPCRYLGINIFMDGRWNKLDKSILEKYEF